jgi:hypothetical protein
VVIFNLLVKIGGNGGVIWESILYPIRHFKSSPMISFDLTLNIFTLLAIIGVSLLTGTLGRYRQLARRKSRIMELEMEMVQAHAELLDMQKEYCELEVKMKLLEAKDPSIPVINIKQVKEQETKKEPAQDGGLPTDRSNRTA